MKKLFANKRATAWLCVCVLWMIVFIITVAWPKEKWIIPPTCFWCSIICDFETGESLFAVCLTLVVFAASVSLFMLGRQRKEIRVLTDITTVLVTVQLIFLGAMRIYPSMIMPNFGYVVFSIGIISLGGMLECIIFEYFLCVNHIRKSKDLGEDRNG